MEKQSFSLKLLSGDFYGQSFIKTVLGPLAGSKFDMILSNKWITKVLIRLHLCAIAVFDLN